MTDHDQKGLTAVDAKSHAQELAFAPVAFYTAIALRDTGLLAAVEANGTNGADAAALGAQCGLSEYGALVLLDHGANLGLVHKEGDRFRIDHVGHFVLHDEMTRVNMDFTRDVFYQALPHLETSVRESRPVGLQTLGSWETVYEGLTHLPEPARKSWFRFDHYYSDRAFDALLPVVFERPVGTLLDVGGNTGRWALKCLAHDPDVRVAMMDLDDQLQVARANIEAAGYGDRVSYHPVDLLDPDQPFVAGADTLWMSQFLDCFSEPEIRSILERAARSMGPDAVLYIVELFPDRQAFRAARTSLDAISLYFTCVANGKSRMYHYDRFRRLVTDAGLTITRELDNVGVGHTVLCCQRRRE